MTEHTCYRLVVPLIPFQSLPSKHSKWLISHLHFSWNRVSWFPPTSFHHRNTFHQQKKCKTPPQTSFGKPWSWEKCNGLEQYPKIRIVMCLSNLIIWVKTSCAAQNLDYPLNCQATFKMTRGALILNLQMTPAQRWVTSALCRHYYVTH